MPRLKVLFVGDSITHGTGGTASAGGYRGQLQNLHSYNGLPWRCVGASVLNLIGGEPRWCGASGQTVGDTVANVNADGPAFGWDVAIVHLGTNDATQRNTGGTPTLATTQANVTTMLDALRAQNATGRVFWGLIIPNQVAAVDTLIQAQNSAISTQIAARSDASYITVVDHYAAFTANASWATDYMNDNTHPKDAGYRVMASTWSTALTAAGY